MSLYSLPSEPLVEVPLAGVALSHQQQSDVAAAPTLIAASIVHAWTKCTEVDSDQGESEICDGLPDRDCAPSIGTRGL
eukprot:1523107-Prymnesium_polylepis.3